MTKVRIMKRFAFAAVVAVVVITGIPVLADGFVTNNPVGVLLVNSTPTQCRPGFPVVYKTTATRGFYVCGDDGSYHASAGGGGVSSFSFTNANGFTGSVTNSTTTPALSLGYAAQLGNLVLASPNGSSGTPLFRALAAADLPSLAESKITNLVSDLAAKVATSTTISTTAPLGGGGALSGNLTLTCTLCLTTSSPFAGDISGTSGATVLATVNSGPGTYGDASHVGQIVVNGKGLTTSGSSVAIVIPESAVTNLTSDLSGKQASGNYITALTGDVTASGPGSVAAMIAQGAVTDDKASLAVKPSCGVVATSNLTLSGLQTIDGVSGTDGVTIVLATAQTTASQNGPWVQHSGAWTRPSWYPSGGTTQAFQFITTFVRLGNTYSGTTWRITSSGAVTIDTTSTTWAEAVLALNSSSVAGTLPPTQLPNPTASTLGGVKSLAAATNKFLTQIGTDGSVSQAQPDISNLSTTGALGGNLDLGANADAIEIANAGTTGTTLNKWAKLTGAPSTAVIVGTSDTDGGVGLVVGGAGTTGNAIVARGGIASCVFDGATTANDYVQFSSSVAGDCHDVGSTRPTGGQILGRVLSTNGGAGTYAMTISGLGIAGVPAAGAACLTCTSNVLQKGNGASALQDSGLTESNAGAFRSAAGTPLDLSIANRATDAAPATLLLTGEYPYEQASTNKTGGNAIVAAAQGKRSYVVSSTTSGNIGGKTITTTINNVSTTLTEASDFACATLSTTACATNIAAAITANGTLGALVTATATSSTVVIARKTGVYEWNVATNAGGITATNDTDGTLTLGPNLSLGTDSVLGGTFTILVPSKNLTITPGGSTTFSTGVTVSGNFSASGTSATVGGSTGITADDAGRAAERINVPVAGSGSNGAPASDTVFSGSPSTGTAAAANFRIRTAPSGSSGSTLNTPVNRHGMKAQGVALTSGAAASVLDVTLPTLTISGGTIDATIIATDGTDMQSFHQIVEWSAVNKGGSYTTNATASSGSKSVSAGTLTTSWSVLNGTNKVTIQVTPTTSLTTTKFLLYYQVFSNGEQEVTLD